MTGRRPYAVSLLATAAALALGVGVGAGPVAQDSVAGSTADRSRLRAEVARLQARTDALSARAESDARALEALVAPLVGDRLADRTVVLVVAPGAARTDVRRTRTALEDAGATVVTTVRLTDDYVDPAKAQSPLEDLALRLVPPGVEFTDGATAIARVGTVLARALVVKPADDKAPPAEPEQDSAEVIAGLEELDALHLDGEPGVRAELAVVVGSARTADTAEAALTGLVAALDAGSRGAVVVGPGDATAGLLRWVRDARSPGLSGASSVDGAGSAAGRVALVLALVEQAAGQSGAYGTGRRADSVVPELDRPAPRVASTASPTG